MGFRLNMTRTAYLVELPVFAFIYLYDTYLIDIYQERASNCHFPKLKGKLRTAITGLKVGLEAGSLLQRATGNGKQCRASCGAGGAGGSRLVRKRYCCKSSHCSQSGRTPPRWD